jgi:ABC-2 type transport system ATP-binding protein
MPSKQEAVTIDDLSHYYGNREALSGISFSVEAGSIFTLLGPNGGGKTTLFRIISTLLPTPRGHVSIFGHDVSDNDAAVRKLLGVVFQSPALDSRLTVLENLKSHGNLYGLSGSRLRSRIDNTLGLVGLKERAGDQLHTLSGGLQRRVELAKSLLHEPRMLILDEPGSGLDPRARREFWDHLNKLRHDQGTTVILTTHLMDEATRADRVAILHEGSLVALGTPKDLIAKIGGDVIMVMSQTLETLATAISERFQQPVKILDGYLRIERTNGHQFIAELVDAFPNQIDSVTFGKPTLEDVFLHHTGQRLTQSR